MAGVSRSGIDAVMTTNVHTTMDRMIPNPIAFGGLLDGPVVAATVMGRHSPPSTSCCSIGHISTFVDKPLADTLAQAQQRNT
jgi:hypothetical protein